MNQNNIFNAVAAICNLYYSKKIQTEELRPKLWLSTVAGLIPGMIAAVMASAFVFLTGSAAGGILTGIFIPLFLEILTGWSGIGSTIVFTDQLLKAKGFCENQNPVSQKQIIAASLYLFRMAVFGILAAYGNALWFILALGGAYLIRGEILSGFEQDPEAPGYGSWITYFAGTLAAAILAFRWSAFAVLPVAWVITLLLWWWNRKILRNSREKVSVQSMLLLGYFSENLLLTAGLILSGGHYNG